MHESWESYVDLSIVHSMIFPEASGNIILESVSQIANDDFFSMIEISHINDAEIRKQVADLIRTSHLRVAFGAHPVILGKKLNLNSADTATRMEAVSEVKKLIDEAKEGGAERLILMSGPDPGEGNRMNADDLLVQSLHELCARAREKSVSISLEPFDRTVEKKCLIGPAGEALTISKTMRTRFPEFGLTYDMAHGTLLDEIPKEALNQLKGHLVHIHLGNCIRTMGHPSYGDKHPRFGLEGGENDVRQVVQFLRALQDIDYFQRTAHNVLPIIGFEVKPAVGERPETVIANVKRTWKKAWRLL